MIIAMEGGEGSGKGTQIRLLSEALISRGFDVLTIFEPGGTRVGQAIRNILLNQRGLGIIGITEAFLFSASRAQQVQEIVRPALKRGKVVISDRSFFSTFAYQGYARGEDLNTIKQLTELAIGNTKPDLVILLDISPVKGLARKKSQNEINRLDEEALEFHEKVRDGYLELARTYPDNWIVIDATLEIQDIHKIILDRVLEALD